jgi:hypothetical protein
LAAIDRAVSSPSILYDQSELWALGGAKRPTCARGIIYFSYFDPEDIEISNPKAELPRPPQ